MEKLLASCGLLILSIPVALYNAFMFTFMWRWFIIPLGAPTIGVIHAWGLFLTLSFFTMSFARKKYTNSDNPSIESFIRLLGSLAVTTLLTGFGFMVHQVM